ncbi:response regulator transcription factor [Microbacterium hominis]|uniref:response regulator transcription factor n=1 Tax=Microbacterium hominis TaxID=162426 RepID=UPI001963EAA4|nr:response regulator transcription factor [Microbacterium hominis]QRY41902.1 response regulator transcription factor [Microbacterium hominis]
MTEGRRPLRVLVVEGQPLFRDLLAGLVDQQHDMRTVRACASMDDALAATDRAIDVALLGPRLPDGDGISLGHALRARSPRLGIIVLSAPDVHDQLREVHCSETAGWGVLSKNLSLTASALVYAIRSVAEGRSVLDPAIRAERATRRNNPLSRLSPRQREVLALVADGLSNAAIARRLAISPRSVEAHLRTSYALLGVGSDPERNARVEAARRYLAHAGVTPSLGTGEIPLI